MGYRQDENGDPVYAPGYSAIDDSGRFLGDSFCASGLATTIHDFKIENDLRLEGAHWWSQGHEWGDFADFAVVDRDNVLGLFDYYGLEEGDVLELKKYVRHIPLPPKDCCDFYQEDFFVDNPAFICSGLYLRCVYDNNGTTDTYIGIVYQTYVE